MKSSSSKTPHQACAKIEKDAASKPAADEILQLKYTASSLRDSRKTQQCNRQCSDLQMKSSSSKTPHQACAMSLKACGSRKTQQCNRQCSDLRMKFSSSKTPHQACAMSSRACGSRKTQQCNRQCSDLQMKFSSSKTPHQACGMSSRALFEKDAAVQQAVQRSADDAQKHHIKPAR